MMTTGITIGCGTAAPAVFRARHGHPASRDLALPRHTCSPCIRPRLTGERAELRKTLTRLRKSMLKYYERLCKATNTTPL